MLHNNAPFRVLGIAFFGVVASVVLASGSQSFAGIVYEGTDDVSDSESVTLGDKIPLLLIHGWNNEVIPGPPSDWQEFISYFNATPSLYQRYKIYEFRYFSNVISVEQLGERLGRLLDQIDSARPEFSGRSFVVIARSMGGLVARSFMEERQQGGSGAKWHGRVIKLITLATPHHGSPVANDAGPFGSLGCALGPTWFLLPVGGLFLDIVGGWPAPNQVNRSDLRWDDYLNSSCWNQSFYSQDWNTFLVALNSGTNPARAYDNKLLGYVGTFIPSLLPAPFDNGHLYSRNVLAVAISDAVGMASDGVVPYESALFDGVLPVQQTRQFVDHDHEMMWKTPQVFDRLRQDLNAISLVTVSGYVRAPNSTGLPNVTVSANNGAGTTTTGADGYFSLQLFSGWSGRVTPTFAGYSFTPPYLNFPALSAAQPGNFTGTIALLPRPTLLSPADQAVNIPLTPTCTWTSVAGKSSYRILIATDPALLPTDPTVDTFPGVTVNATPIAESYVVPNGTLVSGTTYYWQVKGRSPTQYGAWSDVRRFSTAPAPTPTIARSPSSLAAATTQGQNPTSQSFAVWNAGTGTLSYTISTNQPWVSVNPSSGTSTGEQDAIAVNYAASGLSPGPYTATVTISATGVATQQTIGVTLTVGAVSSTWTIAGNVRHNSVGLSGVELQGLPGNPSTNANGDYSVVVPDGFSATVTPVKTGYVFNPPSLTYTNLNQSKTSENYTAAVPGPGLATLTVNLAPQEAIDGGAGWRVSGYRDGEWVFYELGYRQSGETMVLDGYNADTFVIEFKYTSSGGWNTPADQTIPYVPGTSRTITGTYTRMAGGVTVTINPAAARSAGAQWRVAGGPWRNSGFIEQNVLIGQQVVEFKPVAGWIHPQNRIVSVANFASVSIADTYINQGTGPLIVAVSPNSGPLEGGTEVTIAGANFSDPATVSFGGAPATQVTVISETEIRAKSPPRPTIESVDVAVTIGSTTTTKANGFSYLAGVGNGMRLVGQIGGTFNAVAVQGNYTYIGEGPSFVVLNTSSVTNPVRVGGLLLDGLVLGIAVSGTRAYVAANDRGLYVIDISNPTTPSLLSVYDTPGNAYNVKELGGILYVADYNGGLLIFDVFDPSEPVLLGVQPEIGRVKGLDLAVRPDGLFAYVTTDYDQRLYIIDVTDPSLPVLRGNFHFASDAKSVAVAWPYAYVATFFDRLRIINVSNPDNPTQAAYFVDYPSWGNDVKIASNRAYIVGGYGLAIVNVTQPNSPQGVATYSDLSAYPAIAIDHGYAFVADGDNGLRILAVANVPPVSQVGQYAGAAMDAFSLTVKNGSAFVGTLNKGLRSIDVTNPTSPVLRGAFNFQGSVYDIALDGNIAYLATGTNVNALRVVDISNPAAPSQRGTLSGDVYLGATVANGYLWLAGQDFTGNNSSVLDVFRLNNPDAPPFVGTLPLGATSTAYDVAVQGGFAYVCDANRGLYIADVNSPGSPTLRSFYPIDNGGLLSVSVLSARAFISDSHWNMRILDVSNPNAPNSIDTSVFPTGSARSSFVSDGLLYVSGGADFGVRVYEVTDPNADPFFVGSFNTSGAAFASFVSGDLVYVADYSGGLVILELLDFRPPTVFITNPFSPTYATSASTINLGGAASDDRGVDHVTWVNHRGGSGMANYSSESWTVTGIVLKPGNNIITVTAYDEQGNAGSDVLTVTYNAPPDVLRPTVTISVPSPTGTYITGASSVDLGGAASDDREVTQVTWSSDRGGSGNAVGTAPWTASGVRLLTGENVLTVMAYDAANNTGTATLTVTVTDADADGVADNDDGCRNTIPRAPVDSSGCPRVVPGDLDRDGDVELGEFSHVVGCLSGPGAGLGELGCAGSDLNGDGDIDLLDIASVQRCFSGTNMPADCRN